jgi:phage portal protein BeeE
MGFISRLVNEAKADLGDPRQVYQDSARFWRQSFGTDKETSNKPNTVPGGSWGRSAVFSGSGSTKRLLETLRSSAPGGWSDSRQEQSAHFLGIAYVAIHRICTQLRQAEFQVFKKDEHHPDGKRPVTPYDPPEKGLHVAPYDLVKLLERPNRQDSFGRLMYRWGQQKFLTGSALTWMVPNKFGVPMELYSIPTAIAIPQPITNPDYPEGAYRIQPVYPYGPFGNYPSPSSAVGALVPAQWMLRFQYPHPILRYEGYSPLTGLRLHLDEIESMDRSRWYRMKRTIRPNGILNFTELEGSQPLPEDEIARIHAEFENNWQGPENIGRLIVGTPGAELDIREGGDEEVDYYNGWDQLVSFAMGGFGITKEAAGMLNGASYAGLFASLKQLHLVTLDPETDDIAADLTMHLAPHFGEDLIVEVRCKRIDDHDLVFTKIDKGIQARAITKNMVLKLLDLPMTKEPWGEEIAGMEPMTLPMGAMVPPNAMVNQMGQPIAAPPPQDGTGNASTPGGEWGPEEGVQAEPEEMDQSRPEPGILGDAAIDLRGRVRKHLCLNGNGRSRRW